MLRLRNKTILPFMKKHLYIIFCLFYCLHATAQTAEQALKEGNVKFQEQNFTEAIEAYKRAISLDKKSYKAYHNLGNVQYLLQDYTNALKNFDKAIALNPKDAEPYQTRGAAYIALQKYDEAKKDLEKSIQLNPKSALAFFHLGEIAWLTKKNDEACKQWGKSNELGYQEAKMQMQKYCNSSKDSVALSPTPLPNTLPALLKSAETKLELRDYIGAVRDFGNALALDKNNAQALFGRGTAEFAQGNHTDACKDWYKALALGHTEAAQMIKDACH